MTMSINIFYKVRKLAKAVLPFYLYLRPALTLGTTTMSRKVKA